MTRLADSIKPEDRAQVLYEICQAHIEETAERLMETVEYGDYEEMRDIFSHLTQFCEAVNFLTEAMTIVENHRRKEEASDDTQESGD